jgi:hypothetical protein
MTIEMLIGLRRQSPKKQSQGYQTKHWPLEKYHNKTLRIQDQKKDRTTLMRHRYPAQQHCNTHRDKTTKNYKRKNWREQKSQTLHKLRPWKIYRHYSHYSTTSSPCKQHHKNLASSWISYRYPFQSSQKTPSQSDY